MTRSRSRRRAGPPWAAPDIAAARRKRQPEHHRRRALAGEDRGSSSPHSHHQWGHRNIRAVSSCAPRQPQNGSTEFPIPTPVRYPRRGPNSPMAHGSIRYCGRSPGFVCAFPSFRLSVLSSVPADNDVSIGTNGRPPAFSESASVTPTPQVSPRTAAESPHVLRERGLSFVHQ
jgi:hypothetical protein